MVSWSVDINIEWTTLCQLSTQDTLEIEQIINRKRGLTMFDYKGCYTSFALRFPDVTGSCVLCNQSKH